MVELKNQIFFSVYEVLELFEKKTTKKNKTTTTKNNNNNNKGKGICKRFSIFEVRVIQKINLPEVLNLYQIYS